MKVIRRIGDFTLFSLLFLSAQAQKKQIIQIPVPTGKYIVGTTSFQWLNYSVKDTFTTYANDYREIAIQIWYPAQQNKDAPKARYAPLYEGADSVSSNSFLLLDFAPDVNNAPVIVICPGRGVSKHEYSAIAEELASNGYVVAGIDMPYLGTVRYFDGRLIKADQRFRMPSGMFAGPYEKVDSFFIAASEIGTSDVVLTINGLRMQNENKRSVFFGKMNLNNIGIFGHSLGGRIAGQALAKIDNIKAYISMEGIAPRYVRMNGVNKPMAYMMSDGIVKNAMVNYQQAIPKRKNDVLLLILNDFGHNSFTDFPFTDPVSASYKVVPAEGIKVGRKILMCFFDDYLKKQKKCTACLENEANIKSELFPGKIK